jgi:PAS domain S-box-containing protein
MIHFVSRHHKGCLTISNSYLYICCAGVDVRTLRPVGMRVGELSRRTGIGVSTLRAWERRFGLLEPERSASGQRLYTEHDVDRVAAVGRLLAEGLTLSSAATRVSAAGPGALSATQREAFLLHQAVQAAGEAIWVAQEGQTRIANRRMAELMHCSVDELMDRSVFDFIEPAWREAVSGHVDSLRAGHRQRFETRLLRPDGTAFLAEVNATPLRDSRGGYQGAVAVITDVTARAEAEADARFRTAALDAIGEAVVAAHLDGTIIYANPAAERLLGWRAEELIGQDGLQLLPSPEASARARQVHARLLAGQRQTGEMRLSHRDGTEFPAHITGSPIKDGRGELVACVAVIRDHSARHRLEQEVRSQEQQAEIAALLAARVLRGEATDRVHLLSECVEASRRALGGDIAALLEVTGPGEDLMVRVSSPHRPEAGRTPGGSRSIAGYAALTGTVVVVEDAQHDRRFDLPPPPAWRDPIVSAIAAPVHGPAGVCGVLIVAGMSQRRFSSASSHFMQSMANVIGMALLLG